MSQKSKFYMEIHALHTEVTGSCYVCRVRFASGEIRMFIVDIGMFQEKSYLEQNEKLTFNPEDVSFVLLTHNHVDHVGRLPLIYKRGGTSNVYCTYGTAMALPINLEDNVKIMTERAKRQKRLYLKCMRDSRYRKGNSEKAVRYTPLYKKEDVVETISHVKPVNYGEWTSDSQVPQISFKFFPNAHLPGAAIIWVKISDEGEDINLLFIGDWNVSNIFQGKFEFPEELRNVPLQIVTEATYGSTYKDSITKTFRQNIQKAVAEGKFVLLPVISQYRAQEVLWYLKDMQEKGEITHDIPIYFCGPMGVQYMTLYASENFSDIPEKMKNFFPKNLKIITIKGNIDENMPWGIYVVTGGMGSNGPSTAFLKGMLPDYETFIQFSSYCAEGTIGNALKEQQDERYIQIGGVLVEKNAQLAFTSELSGHAKADELLDFLSEFNNIKTIMIAHGSIEAKNAFHELVIKRRIAKKAIELERFNYVRLNKWGLIQESIWQG